MQTSKPHTLLDLAHVINAQVQGDFQCVIYSIAPLSKAKVGDLSFLHHPRYRKYLSETKASAILITPDLASECTISALISDRPEVDLIKLLNVMYPAKTFSAGIDPTAKISADCTIDATATIGPYVVIEPKVKIGAHTIIEAGSFIGAGTEIGSYSHLYPRVTLYHEVIIGDRALIHSGAVIGADGFGFAQDKGRWIKIPQIGGVVIGHDVEIGANTTIDRGALENTCIGNGVKIDDQVMVAHNVQIGDHTAIAGCVGIAGSARIGSHCMIGGGACINGHIEITDRVIISGMAMVVQSIKEAGIYSSGVVTQPNRLWHKNALRFAQLDEMAKRLKRVEQNLLRKQHEYDEH